MPPKEHFDIVIDDRPIATRRPRRSQGLLVEEGARASTKPHSRPAVTEIQKAHQGTVSTPRKKRTRFSDPGPPSDSTGLTPALRRYRVADTPSSKGVAKRRHSFPAKRAASPTAASATLQFAPLRQLIDGRSRRRLKRNHLSEEINKIEEEKKDERRLQRESIFALKKQVEESEEKLGELSRRLKGTKKPTIQFSIQEENMADETYAALEPDDAQSEDGFPQHKHATNWSFAESGLYSLSEAGMVNDVAGPEITSRNEGFHVEVTHDHDSSPEKNLTLPPVQAPAISTGVQVSLHDPQHDALELEIQELKGTLQKVLYELEMTRSTHQRLFDKIRGHLQDMPSSFSETPSEIDAALDTVLTSLVLSQSRAEDAEAGLTMLSSKVHGLGFDGNTADEVLQMVKDQFRQTRLELEYLQPGETVEGFENDKLLGMLVERVRLLLQNLRDSAEEQDAQRRVVGVLRKQLDLADAHAKTSDAKAREIAIDLDEKERSIAKLKHALDGYRTEVKDLEKLVNRLEAEHAEILGHSRKEMDEAVADLEEKLEMQTKSKDEAIQEIRQMKTLAEELQNTIDKTMSVIESLKEEKNVLIAAKDAMIAHFEIEGANKDETYESALAAYQEEINDLQLDKTSLTESLREAEISIGTLTDANTALEARMAIEMEESVRVMESMQSEMMRSLARVGELKNRYANRDGSGDGVVMPATPCSLRFATTPKKKRRVDSGIGVLQEEDEEMMDV